MGSVGRRQIGLVPPCYRQMKKSTRGRCWRTRPSPFLNPARRKAKALPMHRQVGFDLLAMSLDTNLSRGEGRGAAVTVVRGGTCSTVKDGDVAGGIVTGHESSEIEGRGARGVGRSSPSGVPARNCSPGLPLAQRLDGFGQAGIAGRALPIRLIFLEGRNIQRRLSGCLGHDFGFDGRQIGQALPWRCQAKAFGVQIGGVDQVSHQCVEISRSARLLEVGEASSVGLVDNRRLIVCTMLAYVGSPSGSLLSALVSMSVAVYIQYARSINLSSHIDNAIL